MTTTMNDLVTTLHETLLTQRDIYERRKHRSCRETLPKVQEDFFRFYAERGYRIGIAAKTLHAQNGETFIRLHLDTSFQLYEGAYYTMKLLISENERWREHHRVLMNLKNEERIYLPGDIFSEEEKLRAYEQALKAIRHNIHAISNIWSFTWFNEQTHQAIFPPFSSLYQLLQAIYAMHEQ